MSRMLRYLAPNLVTCLGILFGLLSVVASLEGRFVTAGWLILWAVMLDRIDGMVARLLRATSEFGVQMDSFADLINFGIAPAVLMFVSLSSDPSLGFAAGPGRTLLLVACLAWVLATVLRLARFNVTASEEPHVFFGTPTTLTAGLLVVTYVAVLKYLVPGGPLAPPTGFGGPPLLAVEVGPGVFRYFPPAMLAGALLMISNLPLPKIGKTDGKGVTAALLGTVLLGYVLGFSRMLPEVLAFLTAAWTLAFLAWGQLSPRARRLHAPPVFPRRPAEDEDDGEGDLLDLPELQDLQDELEHQHQG